LVQAEACQLRIHDNKRASALWRKALASLMLRRSHQIHDKLSVS
jgi:hypothetical protein